MRGPANGSGKWSGLKVLPSSEIKEEVNPENPRLKRQLSVVLRDQLLNELTGIGSAEEAALYARRILPAKNSLDAADARQLEDAFQTKLAELDGGLGETCAMPSQSVSLPQATSLLEPQGARSIRTSAAETIDESQFAPVPRRVRDKDHVRFVAKQACLICGRTPSDAHHLRFAQTSGSGPQGQR